MMSIETGSAARLDALPEKPEATQVGTMHAWRRWATRHRVAAAMLGGLAGVHIASLLGFWFGGFGLTRLDYNTANGMVYLPDGTHLQQFLVGGLSHYVDGVLFAVIFAIAIAPRLPLPATAMGNVGKALLFGTVLGVLALLVTAPFVFGPARGVHDALIAFHSGWEYVLSVLIFHWLYGLHLGLIYNPLDGEAVLPPDRQGQRQI
ncbi:hypothetical protein [Streptomyces sp. SID13031]|uniref:hypothetical protein n=1 Tax=Streptomyces sp. SID13031 TaxID=2706046 RepID=UPI0013CAA857|nr:hypothetical protein [Streptomyces sp. SID13031]NEA31327.1 hypothetical protein [Streptomyces sp. SID13031]